MVVENEIPRGTYTFDAPQSYDQPFRQARGNRWDAHIWTYANLGSIQCFEENPLPESPALRGDLPQEEYAAPGSPATVTRVRWKPNTIVLDVVAQGPSRVLVNQNHDIGWRASVGKVVSHDGLLAVDLPAGTHRLELHYVNKWFRIGALISGFTLLGLLLWTGRGLQLRARAALARYRALPWSRR